MRKLDFGFCNLVFEIKNPVHCRQKGATLRAAGTVRHVVAGEHIAKRIHFTELCRRIKCRQHERQTGVTELIQIRLDEGKQFGAIANLAVLPRCFKA